MTQVKRPLGDDEETDDGSGSTGATTPGSATDPFLDADLGPTLWTQIAPTGKRYWPFILLLAIALSGFSYYWRNHVVPTQPLVWQIGSDVQLRQAIGSGHPVLVWYDPFHQTEVTNSDLNGEKPSALDHSLGSAIASLDVPIVRQSLRLRSAELWKVETLPKADLVEQLLAEENVSKPVLLLWHAEPSRRVYLKTDEINVQAILSWLETTRRRHV
ncbi:MAG: hypothetical protein Q8M16_21845 [Pirellulaceae bacterium]|nr:hypothetical protein [Pirellulaceae bacterium]